MTEKEKVSKILNNSQLTCMVSLTADFPVIEKLNDSGHLYVTIAGCEDLCGSLTPQRPQEVIQTSFQLVHVLTRKERPSPQHWFICLVLFSKHYRSSLLVLSSNMSFEIVVIWTCRQRNCLLLSLGLQHSLSC